MKIDSYLKAESLEQAYKVLSEKNDSSIIAGGAWLKLMPKTIGTAIDIAGLGLDTIIEKENEYEIGAMVTLRQLEIYESFWQQYQGILNQSASNIMGITVRNIATIGGTVAGKYGFSDLLPVLVAMDSSISLYKGGRIKLLDFMNETGTVRDIITHINIPKAVGIGWFETMKNTAIDFPILNAAIAEKSGGCTIVVGARPYKTACAFKAMEFINAIEVPTKSDIVHAADLAADELKFGKNQRGSAEYRKELCRAFIKRGLWEVIS